MRNKKECAKFSSKTLIDGQSKYSYLDPLAEKAATYGIVPVLSTSEAEGVSATASHRRCFHIRHLYGVTAVWRRAPAKQSIALGMYHKICIKLKWRAKSLGFDEVIWISFLCLTILFLASRFVTIMLHDTCWKRTNAAHWVFFRESYECSHDCHKSWGQKELIEYWDVTIASSY